MSAWEAVIVTIIVAGFAANYYLQEWKDHEATRPERNNETED